MSYFSHPVIISLSPGMFIFSSVGDVGKKEVSHLQFCWMMLQRMDGCTMWPKGILKIWNYVLWIFLTFIYYWQCFSYIAWYFNCLGLLNSQVSGVFIVQGSAYLKDCWRVFSVLFCSLAVLNAEEFEILLTIMKGGT